MSWINIPFSNVVIEIVQPTETPYDQMRRIAEDVEFEEIEIEHEERTTETIIQIID